MLYIVCIVMTQLTGVNKMNDQDIFFGVRSSRTAYQYATLVNIFNKSEVVTLNERQKLHLRKPNKLRIKMSTYPVINGSK